MGQTSVVDRNRDWHKLTCKGILHECNEAGVSCVCCVTDHAVCRVIMGIYSDELLMRFFS